MFLARTAAFREDPKKYVDSGYCLGFEAFLYFFHAREWKFFALMLSCQTGREKQRRRYLSLRLACLRAAVKLCTFCCVPTSQCLLGNTAAEHLLLPIQASLLVCKQAAV